MQHALQLISMALLAGFAVSLLWSEAQLVEVNDQIQKAKAELVSEQSQYTYYNSVLNSKTNITSVEEVAGRLGLMKMDQSSSPTSASTATAYWCAESRLSTSGRISCTTVP